MPCDRVPIRILVDVWLLCFLVSFILLTLSEKLFIRAIGLDYLHERRGDLARPRERAGLKLHLLVLSRPEKFLAFSVGAHDFGEVDGDFWRQFLADGGGHDVDLTGQLVLLAFYVGGEREE